MPTSTTILLMSDVPDFETALKRLEEIVKKLENGLAANGRNDG